MSEDKKDDNKDAQTSYEGQVAKTEQLNQTEQLGQTRQAGQTGKNKYTAHKTRIWRPFRRSDYRAAWVDQNIIGILKEFCRDLRRCHQRIWKGYCDYDLYSIYEWFRRIMPPMLENFKDNLHGYPSSFYDISSSEAEEDKSDKADETDETSKIDKGMKVWQNTLDKMIFLFRESDRETCSHQNPYEEEYSKRDSSKARYPRLG